jgi:hypothetical protein
LWGGKESESKNHWFWLFQKPQRTGEVFLKEPVENQWLYRLNCPIFKENHSYISGPVL